jgi:hypothetical protein
LPKLKEDLLQCVLGSDDKGMSQVLGIREAKGLDFAEVVIVDFFRCLDERQQASWKQLLQASPCDGFCNQHPEVETHLKLLYTAVTRSQRRLNFVETVSSKAASAFFRRLEEEGKLVKLSSELKLATGMMSPDEWIHRGLEFAWKAWECRSEDRGGGGTGSENQDTRFLKGLHKQTAASMEQSENDGIKLGSSLGSKLEVLGWEHRQNPPDQI